MKTILFTLAFVVCTFATASAQDQIFSVTMKEKDVPAKIITSVKERFPGAIITEYAATPVTLVKESGVVFYDHNKAEFGNYDSYVISMTTKQGEIQATYDAKGKFIGTAARLKSVALPPAVRKTIGADFPGWAVGEDQMIISTNHKGMVEEHFRVKLNKDGEHRTVMVAKDGTLNKAGKMHRDGKHKAKTGKHKAKTGKRK